MTEHSTRAQPARHPKLAARTAGLIGSSIDSSISLLARQPHDVVRFAVGSPAAEAIPTAILAGLAATELGPSSADAYDYAATEGDPLLRGALLDLLAGTDEATTPDRLTITSGGMQGIDLACKLFVNRGDLVLAESPTYSNGSAAVLAYGGEVLEVPMDGGGMVVESLPDLVTRAGRRPVAIYTTPNFQNPSGTTMTLDRRRTLIDLARRWGAVIIDDDPYGLLRFSGEPLPSLHALSDGDPCVFSVRTFSKIIAPGLRVGWVDAAPEFGRLLINAKQVMDSCANLPSQRLVGRFLADGQLAEHLAKLRKEYHQRKVVMQQALAENFSGIASWTDPDGGFFLWVTLSETVDTQRLFDVALAEGVAFIPGRAFSPTGQFGNALRLCFASTPPDRTRIGIRRLRRSLDMLTAEVGTADRYRTPGPRPAPR